MRLISGAHVCPSCEKETKYERQKTPGKQLDIGEFVRLYATRPGKTLVAALSDKNAWTHICENCKTVVAQCPYCRTINKADDEVAIDCTKCTNMFIVQP